MKKFLMTLIVSLVFCGSIFAQHPTSFWDGQFQYSDYEMQGALYASIMINGEPVTTATPDWDVLEVAAFVDGQLRMVGMFLTDEYLDYDLFPTLNAEPVYYTTPGEEVTFMMYNHNTGFLYETCEPVIWDGDPITILTGEEHWEGVDDPDHPLMLNFIGEAPVPTTIDKIIDGYVDDTNEGGWYLIASPSGTVDFDNVGNLIPADNSNFDLFYFNQAGDDQGNQWMNHRNGSSLECGKGYLYANQQTVTLQFPGDAYTGDGNVTLAYDENATLKGWNLVGNPFNENATIGERDFLIMNENGSGLLQATERDYVMPMEGIFVLAENAEDTELTFTPASSTEAKGSMVTLNLSNGRSVIDRASVRFGQGRMLPKLQLWNTSSVYIPVDNVDYTVVRSEGMGELPVCFKADKNGAYCLSFTATNAEMAYLHLIDNKTGNDVDLLAQNSYSFDALTSDYANRFKLVFATGNSNSDNFAFFSNGNFVINNDGEANLQVVDVNGRILKDMQINGCTSVNINAAPGVYMLRLVNGNDTKVQKVVVK